MTQKNLNKKSKTPEYVWLGDGLGIRLVSSTRKTYVVQYSECKKLRIKSIGNVASITLDAARAIAKQYRVKKQSPISCDEAFELWLNRYAKLQTKTWSTQQKRWMKYISPRFGSVALRDLKRDHVANLISDMLSTPTLANRMLELVSAVFEQCKKWEIVSLDNPCKYVSAPRLESRTRFLTRDELSRVLIAIDTLKSEPAKIAIGLLIFTGCRTSEILGLRWQDVDLQNKAIILRTTKNKRSHIVPLSPAALSLIESLTERSGWVFPSPSKSGHVESLKTAWATIKKRTGINDIRLHDLRRTVGSLLAQDGISINVIGDVLNHRSPASTAIYARLDVSSRASALSRFAEIIGACHPFAKLGACSQSHALH